MTDITNKIDTLRASMVYHSIEMRKYRDDFGGRIVNYIVTGNVAIIKALLEIKFLHPQYDTFDFTGGNTGNPEDSYLILELIADQNGPIPNYKEMIDLILSHGAHVDDHSGPITPLEFALIKQNIPVAAYLMSKGGTYNIEEIKDFCDSVKIDLVAMMNEEYAKLIA
jgi:hypothetical protein